MKTRLNRSLISAPIALLALVGCQTDKHTMVEAAPGTTIVCQKCYDQIEVVHNEPDAFAGPTTIIKKHQCADCNTEMSIYRENGVAMVKCAKCAPEGVPCDKCLPPDKTK